MYLNGKKVQREGKHKRVFFTTPKRYQQILNETSKEERKDKSIIEMADEIYLKTKKKIE